MGAIGTAKAGSGNNSITNTPEYQDAYSTERMIQEPDVPIPAAMDYEGRDDATVETQMRGYRSAIGDPIRAMENARKSVLKQLVPYANATSTSNLGTKQAMQDMVDSYDKAIEKMRRIKANSLHADLL